MEFFLNGKTVRLRSHYKKYLVAKDDRKSVGQDGDGSSKRAEWTVEVVADSDEYIRLKSCYNKYLTASGEKVLQTLPSPDDSAVEWQPINDGDYYRLKSRDSTHSFLRGSGWHRLYSVTHYTADNETMNSSLKWDIEDVMTPPADPPFAFENVGSHLINAANLAVSVVGVTIAAITASKDKKKG